MCVAGVGCKKAIVENRALLDAVVVKLLEDETIGTNELDALVVSLSLAGLTN